MDIKDITSSTATARQAAAGRRAGWSALFDGECAPHELDFLLADDDAAQRDAAWDVYRCIGEALRAQEAARPQGADPAFVQAVMAQVRAQPHAPAQPVRWPVRPAPRAANGPWQRWGMAAAVAAAVGLVALAAWQTAGLGGHDAQWAATPLPATAPAAGGVAGGARDPQLEELVAAHRSWGHASALNAPAGFLRTVAYEAPGR
ncbi:hypothetical protein Talka_01997 [Tepidimonas alkaliphilus]|uniref:Anti sigma-E protein RseA N-terminal domain-containing protein n=1 Tax=Tepidimonas alkaliphilus TaxID=2588942 RepID=A0A554W548_9BURK|nr:RseA family anti-sigma factor [Tepidimonas alkaliphilus]TSE18706.1 hypothetical protein Talka_01997 [Tepidimonas alkaliphilus]